MNIVLIDLFQSTDEATSLWFQGCKEKNIDKHHLICRLYSIKYLERTVSIKKFFIDSIKTILFIIVKFSYPIILLSHLYYGYKD